MFEQSMQRRPGDLRTALEVGIAARTHLSLAVPYFELDMHLCRPSSARRLYSTSPSLYTSGPTSITGFACRGAAVFDAWPY